VNERFVRDGFATVSTFPPNVRYFDRFLAAERAAREDGVGLWGACR
jgi:micrococcal nuclease